MKIMEKIDLYLEGSPLNLNMAIAELEKITEDPIVHPRDTVWFKTIRQTAQKWTGSR